MVNTYFVFQSKYQVYILNLNINKYITKPLWGHNDCNITYKPFGLSFYNATISTILFHEPIILWFHICKYINSYNVSSNNTYYIIYISITYIYNKIII